MDSPLTSPEEDDLLAKMEEGLWEVRVQWQWMQQRLQKQGPDADRPPSPTEGVSGGSTSRIGTRQQPHITLNQRCCSPCQRHPEHHEMNCKDAYATNASLLTSKGTYQRQELVSDYCGEEVPSGREGPSVREEPSGTERPSVREGLSVGERPSVREGPFVRKGASVEDGSAGTASAFCSDDGPLISLKPVLLEFIECMLEAVKFTSIVTVDEVKRLKTSVGTFLGCKNHARINKSSPAEKTKWKRTDDKLTSKEIKHKRTISKETRQKRRMRGTATLAKHEIDNQSERYSNKKCSRSNSGKITEISCNCFPHQAQRSNSALLCQKQYSRSYCKGHTDRSSERCSVLNDSLQRTRPLVDCCPYYKSSANSNQDLFHSPCQAETKRSCHQTWSCLRCKSQQPKNKPLSDPRYFDGGQDEKITKYCKESTGSGCIQSPATSSTYSEKRSRDCPKYNLLSANGINVQRSYPPLGYFEAPYLQENFQLTLLILDDHNYQLMCLSEAMLLQHHNILSAITILCRVPPKSWMSWVDDLLGLIMTCLRSSSGFLCHCRETTVFLKASRTRSLIHGSRQVVSEHECCDKCWHNVREHTEANKQPQNHNEDCSKEYYSLRVPATSNKYGRSSRDCKLMAGKTTEPCYAFGQANRSFGNKQTGISDAKSLINTCSAEPKFWTQMNTTQEGFINNQRDMHFNTRNEATFKETVDFTTLHRMGCLFAAALCKAHKIGEKLSRIKKEMDDHIKPRSETEKHFTTAARKGITCRTQRDSTQNKLCHCKWNQEDEKKGADLTTKCDLRGQQPQKIERELRGLPDQTKKRELRRSTSSSSKQTRSLRKACKIHFEPIMKKTERLYKKETGFYLYQESAGRKKAHSRRIRRSNNHSFRNRRTAEYLVGTKSYKNKSSTAEEDLLSKSWETSPRNICKHTHVAGARGNCIQKRGHPTALTLAHEKVDCPGCNGDTTEGYGPADGIEHHNSSQEFQSSSSIFSGDIVSINITDHEPSDVLLLPSYYTESQATSSMMTTSSTSSSLPSQCSNSANRSASSCASGVSVPRPVSSALLVTQLAKRPLSSTGSEIASTYASEADRMSSPSFTSTFSTDDLEPMMSPFCNTRFPPRDWLQLREEGEALLGEWRQLAPHLLSTRFMVALAKDTSAVDSNDSDGVRSVLVSLMASVGSCLRGVVGEICLQHRQWTRLVQLPPIVEGNITQEMAANGSTEVTEDQAQGGETQGCFTHPSNDPFLGPKEPDRSKTLPTQKVCVGVQEKIASGVSVHDNTTDDHQNYKISDFFVSSQLPERRFGTSVTQPQPKISQDNSEMEVRSDPIVTHDDGEDPVNQVDLQNAANKEQLEVCQSSLASIRLDEEVYHPLEPADQKHQSVERNEENKKSIFVGDQHSFPSRHALRQQEDSNKTTYSPGDISISQPQTQSPCGSGEDQQKMSSRKGALALSGSLGQQGPAPHKQKQVKGRPHSRSSEYLHALATADALLESHKKIFLKLLLLANLDSMAALPRLISQFCSSLLTSLEQSKLLVVSRPALCPETSRSCLGYRQSATPRRRGGEAGAAAENTAKPSENYTASRNSLKEVKCDGRNGFCFDSTVESPGMKGELAMPIVCNISEGLFGIKQTISGLNIGPSLPDASPQYAGHVLCYHHSSALAFAHQLAVLLLR